MMMKLLEAGGLPPLTDNSLRTADEDNPKGYYEFEREQAPPTPGFALASLADLTSQGKL